MASITIDEAARYLNVSTRTISTYISQGIISYHKKQGSKRKYINANDVYELKEAKACGDFSVKNFKKLQSKVRRLESQMEVILKILDTNKISMSLTPEDGAELFNAASSCLESTLTIDYVDAWLPIFLSIDEYDLEAIQQGSKSDKPWYPFVSLCVSLIVYVTGHRDYSTTLSMQLQHKELAEARRRLRLSALLYIEGRGPKIEVDNLVTTRPETVIEQLKKWAT